MNHRTVTRRPLEGRSILIVEDRYFIASEIASEVRRLGGRVVGPSGSVARAAALLAGQRVDLGLLDVNLEGELVFPIAEALVERGIPFIFLTGYDEANLPEGWRDRPLLEKPVSARALSEALSRVA
jgi:CheY-like chemotaxis protein